MKLLIIGGMHGNEPLGITLVERLKQQPIKNVDALLANEQAVRKNCRFVGADLNRSFPGNTMSEDYEQQRAAELLLLCEMYDVVLDFHNTHCPNNDCGFVGDTAEQRLYDVSARLGIPRIVVADYDCINKYAPNCLSVEISLTSKLMDVEAWYEQLRRLARLETVTRGKTENYKFVYRMTLEDRDKLDLPSQQLRAFEPLGKELASAMGVASPAYPIFVADQYTPYNYGGLLSRLDG